MEPIYVSLSRLEKAVDRLEAAVEQRQMRFDAERHGLLQAVQAARSDQTRTAATAETVSNRLDGAIERLNAVLEH